MNIKNAKKIILAFLAMIMIGFTSTLYITDNQATLQKLVWMSFAFVGICIIGIKLQLKEDDAKYVKVAGWLVTPYLVGCVYTFCVLCVTGDQLGVLQQSITTTIFIVVDYCMVVALFFFFREKTPYMLTCALVFSYCLTLYIGIKNISFIKYVAYLKGETEYLDSWFEMHDVGVAVVPLILYFFSKMVIGKKEKKDVLCVVGLVIVMILCGKRSAEGALLIGLLVIILSKTCKKNHLRMSQTILLCVFAASFFYVWIIQSGVLQLVCKKIGINTMGRIEVYTWFNNQYSISPFYFGKGFQYIHKYMLAGLGSDVVNDFQYLHNSILQIYIEIGFLGFVFWFFVLLYKIPQKFRKHFSIKAYHFYVAIIVSTIFMYTVDNVLTYPLYIVSMGSVLFAYTRISEEKIGFNGC